MKVVSSPGVLSMFMSPSNSVTMFCRWPTPVRFLSFAVHLHGVENLIAVEYLSEIFRCDAFAGIGYLQNKTFVFVYNVTLMFPLSGVYLKALDMRFPAILLKQLRSVFHVSSGAMSRQ